MARHNWQMKLTDVHGQAFQIAQEFKTIETSFGTHCLSKLLPLVLGVLERLELYVEEYEKLQTENAKMNLKISGQDRSDSAASGLDSFFFVVAPNDAEALKTLERTRPATFSSKVEMSTTHSMPRLLPAPGSSMLENASPSPTSPAAFSLHTPEAPATSLSHTQANTLACAVEASIEQQLQIAQSTVMKLQEDNLQLMTKLNQLSKSYAAIEGEYQQQLERAKHYKEDLLSVLMEKTELKQSMMAVQDELDITKRQLKECISRLSSQQQQLDLLET